MVDTVIRLFPADAETFTTLGLGAIADAVSCSVKEVVNGYDELTMVYPADGIRIEDIVEQNIIVCKPQPHKNPQPFQIYRVVKGMGGTIEVYAEHIANRLRKITVSPFSAASLALALQGLKNNAEEDCPFTFWTDKTVASPYTQTVPASIRQRLGGEEGSILDLYGGEYEWDNFMVRLWNHRGTNRGVTIRYGKNLIDLTQERNIADTYTGVYPFWTGTVNDQNVVVTLPEKILHSDNASSYPYSMTVPLDLSMEFEEQPSVAQLRSRAQTYITANNIGVPSVSLKVSFIDLQKTMDYADIAPLEQVDLGDIVTVQFEKLGVEATAEIVSTDYNVLTNSYNSVEIGEVRASLSSTIAQQSAEIKRAETASRTFFEQAIDAATKLITGGLGGNILFHYNDITGYPDEIIIMDTDSTSTAVNCIRINKNGIGFSQSGYNGPFNSAWTIDNTFDAEQINVVHLDATSITTGILTDSQGQNYWDFDTGEFSIHGYATTTQAQGYADTALASAESYTDSEISLLDGTLTSKIETYGWNEQTSPLMTYAGEVIQTYAGADISADAPSVYSWITQNTDSITALVGVDQSLQSQLNLIPGQITAAVSALEGQVGASLVLEIDTDDQNNPYGKISANADYVQFDTGDLVINSNGLKLDSGGNAIFSGAVTATALTLGGGVNIGVDKVSGFADATTDLIEGTVTASFVNALGITAQSVAAENITGTTISGKRIQGGIIYYDANNYWNLQTGEIRISSFANQFSTLQSSLNSTQSAVDALEVGIAVDNNGVTVGRQNAAVKGVFSNDSLEFQTTGGEAIAWLSSDASDGLGVDLIQIGSHTTANQRWIVKTDQNGDRLTFSRRAN